MISFKELQEYMTQVKMTFGIDVPAEDMSEDMDANKAVIMHAYSRKNPTATVADVEKWYEDGVRDAWKIDDDLYDVTRDIFISIEMFNPSVLQFASVYENIKDYTSDAVHDAEDRCAERS